MTPTHRFCATLCALWLAIAAVPLAAQAQAFPAKPFRLVVGWPPGGTVDGVARTLAPALAEVLGQPVVVENKPGASGSLGAGDVASARADGYTLGIVFDTQAVNQHVYKGLRQDTFKSFTYISRLVTAPQILVAANAFPADDVAEMVRYAKANPGKINYASTGNGSSNHLNALLLANRAGIEMVHVPYKGGAPAITDMIGGQVDVMVVSAPSTMPFVTSGRIKVLGTGSAKPLPQLPRTRPIGETVPGYEASSWVGLIGPAGLPPEVSARLEAAAREVLDRPDIKGKLVGSGYEIIGSSGKDFTAFMRVEYDKWEKVFKENRIDIQ